MSKELMDSIKATVITAIENELSTSVSEEDLYKPFDEIGVDSLDIISIAINVEEVHDIDVPDDEILNMKTGNDLVSFIYDTLKG